MDPYTMQTSFSEVRSSMTLPRGEVQAEPPARRFSAGPTSNIMFTSTASIQLSQASRVGRASARGPMMTSGEYFFDEEFSVPFDANLIVGTPLDEDSLRMTESRGSQRPVSNLQLVSSRSDGCLFYPDDLDEEVGRLKLNGQDSGRNQTISVTSDSSDPITGASNFDQTSWSGTPAMLQSALLRRVPEYKLVYETSGSGQAGVNSCDSSPKLTRSRRSDHSPRQRPQHTIPQRSRSARSTWAEVAARRTSGGLMRWTSSQELSTHDPSDEGVESPPSQRKLTTWGRIHSAASRERLNLMTEGESAGSGTQADAEASDEASILRTGGKTPAKTTWRQLRQQRSRMGPNESSGSSSDLIMARSRSMEALNRTSRGVNTLADSPSRDASTLPRRSNAAWNEEFQQRAARGSPCITDSRSRIRRNSSAAAAFSADREGRRKSRNDSGGSSASSGARRQNRASSQPPLAAKSRQLMAGLSTSGLPDLSFLSTHLTKLKERAATEGERIRRTQSCQVLNTTDSHSSPPASCDSGFDSNEQSALLCKRCGSLTNMDREETPRGPRSRRRSVSRTPALSQGLPSRHRSEPDLAQLYVHTDDIPIEPPVAQPAPPARPQTPLKSCLVSRSKSPQSTANTPTAPPSGHTHRGSLDFTPGREGSRGTSPVATGGTGGSGGGGGGELKKSVSFSRAVRVQQAAASSGGQPRNREQSPPSDLKIIPTAVGLYGTESESSVSYPVLVPNSSDASPSDESSTNGSVSSQAGLDVSQKRYKALVDDVIRSANAAVLSFSPSAVPSASPAGPTPRPNPLAMVAPLTTLVCDGLTAPGSHGNVDSATLRLAKAKTRLWPMVEESCRPGHSHRVLTEVLREVKSLTGITNDRAKFRAFLCSCLNNKALSLWLDSLVRNEPLLRRFYYQDAFLRLASLHSAPNLHSTPKNAPTSGTANVVRKLFHSELMSSLEKLLTLPYRLDVSVEAKRTTSSDWMTADARRGSSLPNTPPKSPSRQPVRARHDIPASAPTVRRSNSSRTTTPGRQTLVERGRGRSVTMERRPGVTPARGRAATATPARTPRT